MKNFMFQYATKKEIIEDTDLIEKCEAIRLLDKYKIDYFERFDNNEDPEIVIWDNCNTNTDYHLVLIGLYANEIIKKNGEYYRITPLTIRFNDLRNY